MTTARALLALAASGLVAGSMGCALDFDRFEPVDASAPSGADRSIEPPASDAGATPAVDAGANDDATDDEPAAEDAGPSDARPSDARAPADGGLDAAPCMPSPSCLMSARTCGMTCMMQDQQCVMRCTGGACRSNCTRTEDTCIMQCQDTCSTCTRSAGCSATAACTDAGP